MLILLLMTAATVGLLLLADDEEAPAASDLLPDVEREWARAQERYQSGNQWAEKVTFGPQLERWLESAERTDAEIAEAEAQIAVLLDRDPSPDLAWRVHALLSAMADARGERTLALERIDRALAAYPNRHYAEPAKLSFFQHLVNQKAIMVWDDDGLAVALQLACDLLAQDERYHYMHDWPWMHRLNFDPDHPDAKRIKEATLEAYEHRAERFPTHAEQARKYADLLRTR